MYEVVIIGAGFAGAVMAERIANDAQQRVLVIEKRGHIGGNAFDLHNEQGHLIHRYGPHIFHTSSRKVWDYLSNFTAWLPYQHRVLAWVDGVRVPIPFNLNSIAALFPPELANRLSAKLIQTHGYGCKVPILKLAQSKDPDLEFLSNFIYQKVFLHYSLKQWGLKPEALDAAVTARIPVHISRDDRYFQDPHQGMPKHGYTELIRKLFDHPKISLLLQTKAEEVINFDQTTGAMKLFGAPFSGKLVYTGPIDALFEYRFGELPYRTLVFEHEQLAQDWYQPVGTVNSPNENNFTRTTEFKHLTGQNLPGTAIVREYPDAYQRNLPGKDIPYYPILNGENQACYQRYKELAAGFPQLIPLGRLAEYRYYDMDQVIARALKLYRVHFQGESEVADP